MKIKSLEDIKEQREKQTLNAHMGAGKWKKGVPVSPTLVMPSTVFHPGMQSWMGNSRRPHLQGNPFKFVAKPTLDNQTPPKTVEAHPKAVHSPPKVAKAPQKAVKVSPEAAKLSTVTAAHEPMGSEASVEARQAESAMSSDAGRLKSPPTHSQTQVSVTVLTVSPMPACWWYVLSYCYLQDTRGRPVKKRFSLGTNVTAVSGSQMSGVKVKTLSEIRQERKRVPADTHDVSLPKKKLTGEATAVQRDHATGQSHTQQLGVKRSVPSSPALVVQPTPASTPTDMNHDENKAKGTTVVVVGDATKPVESQCAEKEILSSTTTTKSLSEAICAPSQSGVEGESSVAVQKQATRVKIRKPSMCSEVKPSPSPDVTAIASIKSAIQLDR